MCVCGGGGGKVRTPQCVKSLFFTINFKVKISFPPLPVQFVSINNNNEYLERLTRTGDLLLKRESRIETDT